MCSISSSGNQFLLLADFGLFSIVANLPSQKGFTSITSFLARLSSTSVPASPANLHLSAYLAHCRHHYWTQDSAVAKEKHPIRLYSIHSCRMTISKQVSRIAVIGAGPSGLAAVKYGNTACHFSAEAHGFLLTIFQVSSC